METNLNNTKQYLHFNEAGWLKLLFLLADTQQWLDDLNKELFRQLPVCKKKFINKHYHLTVSALAHILERHYYKINRYPHAGKFHIPLIEIINYIREAHAIQPTPNENDFQRIVQTQQPIGYDKNGHSTNIITILTDAGGRIITVFPGRNGEPCFHDNIDPVFTTQ